MASSIEILLPEAEALEREAELRAAGVEVTLTHFEGGCTLTMQDSPEARENRREFLERKLGRRLQGTCLWWRDHKGYGRIEGDDGYVYFCHFASVQADGYRTLSPGDRVDFQAMPGMADHGRLAAVDVRSLAAQ